MVDVPLFSAEIKIVDESYRRATTLPAGGVLAILEGHTRPTVP